MNDILILAAPDFWGSSLGGPVKALLGAVGVIVVIIGILNSVGKFLKGDIGKGIKVIMGAVVLAAFCFAPKELIGALTSTVANLLQMGTSSVDEIAGSGGRRG